jgi:hypothetical protein
MLGFESLGCVHILKAVSKNPAGEAGFFSFQVTLTVDLPDCPLGKLK